MGSSSSLRRWQWITASSLFSGYAAYYICRANLSVATPLLLAEYSDRGLNKEGMGLIASAGVATYAIGKIINGLLADRLGGRPLFLGGLFASVVCTGIFAVSGNLWSLSGVAVFAAIWAANRLFQSCGWVALVNIASRWFPLSRHATIMAFLSCSFLLKPSPSHVGADEPEANPINLYGEDGQKPQRIPLRQMLAPLARSPLFWTVCLTNFGLTLIRETFNFWTPTYLNEVSQLPPGLAAAASLSFPLVGAVSAIVAGVLSDRLAGRHGRIMVPSICGLIVALVLLGTVDLTGRPWAAVLLLSLVSFFLLGPYSYLSGVMALDIGGKQASGTVSGLSDSAGYGGAILSGYTVGLLAERYGWNTAFLGLAGVSLFALATAVIYWRLNERQLNQTTVPTQSPHTSTPNAKDV